MTTSGSIRRRRTRHGHQTRPVQDARHARDAARQAGPGTARPARRGKIAPLAAGVLLAAFAAACSSGSATTAASSADGSTQQAGTTSLSDVTLHIGDQAGSGAQALLTAAGLIHKLPFKAAWSDFTSGPPMLQAEGAGAVDIGGVGDAPPVFAAAGGDKVAIVGALRANPLGSAILVPKNSPIHTIAQLKGKRIAVTQGSSADYHLLTVLQQAHLGVHAVTLDYLQPADGQAALSSGHVDAWDIWSPFIEQGTAKGARILVNGKGFGAPYSFEVASRAALGDPAKAAAIRAYLKLLDRAHAWANTHQAAWAKVWAQGTGLPESVMLSAANDSASTAVPITPAVISAEQHIADAFQAAGLIPGKVDFANFAVTSFNNTVRSSS
jgi:sulfonate transport system substrate-binding protein